MKYAKITNGVIEQIQPNLAEGFVEIPDDAVPGMLWDGTTLSAPAPAAPTALGQIAAVDALYDSTCAACTHLTYTWQADRQGAGAIVAKHHILEGTPPANTTWVDAGNVIRTLTWADFESLKDRLFTFHEGAFTQKHTHRNAIEALSDAASVSAYNITTGWPT